MAFDLDLQAFESRKIEIGLSSIVGVSVLPAQAGLVFKMTSGGTLWIGGATIAPGIGYPMDLKEVIGINGRGTFYLAAQSATCIGYIFRGGTQDGFGT